MEKRLKPFEADGPRCQLARRKRGPGGTGNPGQRDGGQNFGASQ